jgi:hypothetical protein
MPPVHKRLHIHLDTTFSGAGSGAVEAFAFAAYGEADFVHPEVFAVAEGTFAFAVAAGHGGQSFLLPGYPLVRLRMMAITGPHIFASSGKGWSSYMGLTLLR